MTAPSAVVIKASSAEILFAFVNDKLCDPAQAPFNSKYDSVTVLVNRSLLCVCLDFPLNSRCYESGKGSEKELFLNIKHKT